MKRSWCGCSECAEASKWATEHQMTNPQLFRFQVASCIAVLYSSLLGSQAAVNSCRAHAAAHCSLALRTAQPADKKWISIASTASYRRLLSWNWASSAMQGKFYINGAMLTNKVLHNIAANL